jgi:hypothetical protein
LLARLTDIAVFLLAVLLGAILAYNYFERVRIEGEIKQQRESAQSIEVPSKSIWRVYACKLESDKWNCKVAKGNKR